MQVIKSRRLRWECGTCSTYGERKVAYRFWWGDLREKDYLEDRGINGTLILKRISKKWYGSIEWIDLTQDRDRWRALMNAVIPSVSIKYMEFVD